MTKSLGYPIFPTLNHSKSLRGLVTRKDVSCDHKPANQEDHVSASQRIVAQYMFTVRGTDDKNETKFALYTDQVAGRRASNQKRLVERCDGVSEIFTTLRTQDHDSSLHVSTKVDFRER